MSEKEPRPDRRKILLGIIAAGMSFGLSQDVGARGKTRSSRGAVPPASTRSEVINDKEYVRAEKQALDRIDVYEHLLKESPILNDGTPEEVMNLLRQGFPDSSEGNPHIPGPNDSPPFAQPELSPKLYPPLDQGSGLRIRFPKRNQEGGVITNVIKVGENKMLLPAVVRSMVFDDNSSQEGVVVERFPQGFPSHEATIASIPASLTTKDIDLKYAVAIHKTFPQMDGPWGPTKTGRIPLRGFLLSPKEHPALEKLVEASIETIVLPELRAAARKRIENSLLLIGNLFEWRFLDRQIREGEGGIGQPVYVRSSGGEYDFCGVIHATIPLNPSNSDVQKGAVAYLVYGPEMIRGALH